MTYEDLVNAFQALYPTEFKHVVAECRVKELEAELGADPDSGEVADDET